MNKKVLNAQKIEAILSDIALGMTVGEACAVNGVHRQRFYEEEAKDPALRERARGERLKVLIEELREYGKRDWRSRAWLIEKLYPERFGDKPIVALQQNNYQLSDKDAQELDARIKRIEDEDKEND